MKKPILIWDIDGTLSSSGRAGLDALSLAIEESFSGAVNPELNLAGATDGGIYRLMCERYGKEYVAEEELAFYETYLPYLEQKLGAGDGKMIVYPTVCETLEELRKRGYAHGLLTGNIKEGARLKNEAHGIASFFAFGAYGDDHWDRNKLGFVVAERASSYLGEEVETKDLLILGDTLKDIACARACGAKVVAVTTGHASREDLQEADWVIDEAAELIDILESFEV